MHEPAIEGLRRIQEIDAGRHVIDPAVTVHLDPVGSGRHAHAAVGRGDLLDGAVGIEPDLVDAHRPVLVEVRRIIVVVVEQVPLAPVFHEGMMVRPALAEGFLHNLPLVFEGAQRAVGHGIDEAFRAVLHPGIGEVELPFPLEDERSFLEPADGKRRIQPDGSPVQLGHVFLEFRARKAHAGPVKVGVPVGGQQAAGVDAKYALDGLLLRGEGTVGPVRHGDAHGEAATFLRRVREVEIVLPTALHTVRSPHGIALRVAPGHVLLVQDHAVVRPVHEVLGREAVVVRHAEPLAFRLHRRDDVMGGIQPHLSPEDAGGGIRRELAPDDGILGRHQGAGEGAGPDEEKSFHTLLFIPWIDGRSRPR